MTWIEGDNLDLNWGANAINARTASIFAEGGVKQNEAENGLSEGQLVASGAVYIMSGAFAVSSSDGYNHISSSIGIQLKTFYTASLEAVPSTATLTSMFPQATTGSLFMVGSGSETHLAFKDIKGLWRTITASIAA